VYDLEDTFYNGQLHLMLTYAACSKSVTQQQSYVATSDTCAWYCHTSGWSKHLQYQKYQYGRKEKTGGMCLILNEKGVQNHKQDSLND